MLEYNFEKSCCKNVIKDDELIDISEIPSIPLKRNVKVGQLVIFRNERFVFIEENYVPALDRLSQTFSGVITLTNTERSIDIYYDSLSIIDKNFIITERDPTK